MVQKAPPVEVEEVVQEEVNERPSVRDSLRSALNEHREEDDKSDVSEAKVKDEASDEKKSPKKRASKKEAVQEASDEKEEIEDTEDLQLSDGKKTKPTDAKRETDEEGEEVPLEASEEEKPKAKAPTSLPKNVSEHWDTLPPTVQAHITKVQKDLTDKGAELGRKIAQYKDMDAVVGRYDQSLRQFGLAPAAVVDRLFQWFEALSGPSKVNAFQQLAKDFGVQLDNYQDSRTAGDTYQQQQQIAQVDPAFTEKVSSLEQQLHQIQEQAAVSRRQAADSVVNNWAKDKPHFERVRSRMTVLLQSQEVPLKEDGTLDFDTAYEQACNSHPEVRALLEQEAAETRKQALADKKRKQQAQVDKAKAASVSIKPAAPIKTSSGNPKLNGKVGVRDSLRAAIEEVKEQSL